MFLAASNAAGIAKAKPMLEPITAISSVSMSDKNTLSATLKSITRSSWITTNELFVSLNIDSGLNPKCIELPTIINNNTSQAY
jgi:hypothetical protein